MAICCLSLPCFHLTCSFISIWVWQWAKVSDELCLSHELGFTIFAYFLYFLTSDDNIAPTDQVGIQLLRVRFCSPRPFSTAGTRFFSGRVLPLDGWKNDTNGRTLRWLCHASLFHGSYQVGTDLDGFGCVTGTVSPQKKSSSEPSSIRPRPERN